MLRPGSSAGQPANDNAEIPAVNEAVPQELRVALRQMLISTKDVPFTDGSKRALRHEGHALNVTYGSLEVLATYNFADSYSAVSFKLLKKAGRRPGPMAAAPRTWAQRALPFRPMHQRCRR